MPRPDAPRFARLERDLARIDRMATLLDARFKLPLIPLRFGLDSIIGLVPVGGDLATFAPSVWIIAQGYRHGARRRTLIRMAANSGIDLVVGAIPLVGDIFDAGYKANLRNARLLRRELLR